MDKLETVPGYMRHTVTKLCELTYFALHEFKKRYDNEIDDSYFIFNVLTNYVGNALMQGTEDGKDLDAFNNFIKTFNQEMDHYIKNVTLIIQKEKLKEAH